MTLSQIENMTAAQIKGNQTSVIEEASKATAPELAAHFVRALVDAKIRDEKLGEQGRTITNLDTALESERAVSTGLRNDLNIVRASQQKLGERIQQMEVAAEQAAHRALVLNDELRKAASLAHERRNALVNVMTFANQLNALVAPILAAE